MEDQGFLPGRVCISGGGGREFVQSGIHGGRGWPYAARSGAATAHFGSAAGSVGAGDDAGGRSEPEPVGAEGRWEAAFPQGGLAAVPVVTSGGVAGRADGGFSPFCIGLG